MKAACGKSASRDRLAAQIAAQRGIIEDFEAALWQDGFNEVLLPEYQSAWRQLERLIAQTGADARHDFALVVPVADNPQQLRLCLDSLRELCRAFDYGGTHAGRYAKLSLLIADDSGDQACIAQNRAMADAMDSEGIATRYFGLDEQWALLQALPTDTRAALFGTVRREALSHKGQANMRNLAYLKLAQGEFRRPTLCYTFDADQQFRINVAMPHGERAVCAVNFLAQTDLLFRETEVQVLTGKVVGDPPVSPAVMAVNFVDDVLAFLREMAAATPHQAYQQPPADVAVRDAAYHDMAELFGLGAGDVRHRYRSTRSGAVDHAACFEDFSQQLARFFHGGHPTRGTRYRHQALRASLQPARTVYTGNYVFRPMQAAGFIPFAPLRLRMSGPTLGRILQSQLGARFASANLPMLHRRTLDATAASEYRPGIVSDTQTIDVCDEFERQFYGDVMLFAMERLAALGFAEGRVPHAHLESTLAAVQNTFAEKYRDRHQALHDRLTALKSLLAHDTAWWHADAHTAARQRFAAFVDNIEHNFGAASACQARLAAADNRAHWRARLLAALAGYATQCAAWSQALDSVRMARTP